MKIYKIVKDTNKLRNPCETCDTTEEGEKIGVILSVILEKSEEGVGLAANQIGIQKRVCLVNVKKPILLINPEIIGKFDKFLYKEGCLSFPGEYTITERYKNIMIRADNHKEPLQFSSGTPKDILECVCVQHEIDHLNGLLMFDRSPPLALLSTTDLLIRGLKNGK